MKKPVTIGAVYMSKFIKRNEGRNTFICNIEMTDY